MFDVSKVTVSKAIKELQDDGFVYSKVKLGTFVCAVLPHTRRYGLIINEHKYSIRKTWSLAQIALRDAEISSC
jgi:DNA-binding GntR family transcriptional regulator